jgi:hypothetical protein
LATAARDTHDQRHGGRPQRRHLTPEL